MQCKVRWPANRSGPLGATLALTATFAAMLTGCGAGEDMLATMGIPGDTQTPSADTPAQPKTMVVTGKQREYLDSLRAAGVRPSSDVLALSVGSYVCQARAAKRTDQQVWDFVLPLVRGDMHDTHATGQTKTAPPSGQELVDVNTATGDYIRIATEQLC